MKLIPRVAIGLSLLLTSPVYSQNPPAAAPGGSPTSGESTTSPTPAASATPVAAASPSATPVPTPEPPPLTPREAVDLLSDADAKQAIEIIRSNYLDAAEVSDVAISKATLEGLKSRLGNGVRFTEHPKTKENSPFRAEVLDDRIGYVRLGSISQDNLQEFDSTLANFAEKKLTSLIIDLRATPPSSDFELATEFLKRLAPKGKMLFAIRRPSAKQERIVTSSQEPAFQGIVVTIVNQKTSGAGELIAGVLRALGDSMVVGSQTAGEAAEFAEIPLRSGKVIQVAVAEVRLPKDLTIFPKGLTPDLQIKISESAEKDLLAIGLEKGVGSLIWEKERPRLNEAALVARTNPEIDEAEEAQRSGSQKRRHFDAPLQRAVDLITTIEIFKKSTR